MTRKRFDFLDTTKPKITRKVENLHEPESEKQMGFLPSFELKEILFRYNSSESGIREKKPIQPIKNFQYCTNI